MGYLQRVVVAVQPLKAPQQTAKRVGSRNKKRGDSTRKHRSAKRTSTSRGGWVIGGTQRIVTGECEFVILTAGGAKKIGEPWPSLDRDLVLRRFRARRRTPTLRPER